MKCELCHQAKAVTVIWMAEGDKERELYVCAACAEKFASRHGKRSSKIQRGSGEFFSKDFVLPTFRSAGVQKNETSKKPVVCSRCGGRLDTLLQNGIVGCPACYRSFAPDRNFRYCIETLFEARSSGPKRTWHPAPDQISAPEGKISDDVHLQTKMIFYRAIEGQPFPHACDSQGDSSPAPREDSALARR